MAELTAEIVRTIIKAEVNELRQEMRNRFDDFEGKFATKADTMSAIGQVLKAVQSLTDDDRDELAGVKGRLHNHNERIAQLERFTGLRPAIKIH